MPTPILSQLTLPVKDPVTGEVANQTYDLPGGGGSGDMTKAVYDTNDDGTVNASDVANSVKFSKTGGDINVSFGVESGSYGYYDENGNFVDFKSQADIDSAVAAAKVGTATAGDVLSGKTFTNSTTSGVSGGMTNNGTESDTLTTAHTSHTISEGYHNGNGVISVASQTKNISVEPGESKEVVGEFNRFFSKVTVNGPAIDTTGNTFTAGTSPEGHSIGGYGCWTSVTINPTPSQPKSTTLSPASSGTTLYPDSGKLLSSAGFSIAEHSEVYTPDSNSTRKDMGTRHDYRFVNTTTVYDQGYSAGDSAGYSRGYSAGDSSGYSRGYSEGNSAGYNSGYSDGQSAGYSSGYAASQRTSVKMQIQSWTPAWNQFNSTLFFHDGYVGEVVNLTGVDVWQGGFTGNSYLIAYAGGWVERGRIALANGTGRIATPYRDIVGVQIVFYNDTGNELNATVYFTVSYV